jgi:predicted nucleotidyltransferase
MTGAASDLNGLFPRYTHAVAPPGPDRALIERLRRLFAGGLPVRLAVLFGSLAKGRARGTSDVDIGFYPAQPRCSLGDELELASRISEAVGLEVDLVRLDGDNPLLGREVSQTGICLFEAEPGLFAAYRARALACWLDFDELIAPHRERWLRRLAGAGP